jgi:hypothetical protein
MGLKEVRDNDDGRSRPIALTKAGKELLFTGRPAWLAAQDQAMVLLGKDGTTAVINIADRILTAPRISIPDTNSNTRTIIRRTANNRLARKRQPRAK